MVIEKKIEQNLTAGDLGPALKIKNLKVDKVKGSTLSFKDGMYNSETGEASYTVKLLPIFLDKMTHLHKATTNDPLYFLNIFFGMSLLFFVISSFWMFMPSTPIFKKGLLFTAGGILLTLLMLFL